MKNKKTPPIKTAGTNAAEQLLSQISEAFPCGTSIEYDPRYLQLQAKLSPQMDVQYGEFVSKPTGPNWVEIESECRELLSRSKDITVLVWFMRCRTQRAGAAGFTQAFELLVELLAKYPDDMHPQPLVDGTLDFGIRANALAGLTDGEGILSDLRSIVISDNAIERVLVKDIERAFSNTNPSKEEVKRVKAFLKDLIKQGDPNAMFLTRAQELLSRLQAFANNTMGEEAPQFNALERLLSPFTHEKLDANEKARVDDAQTSLSANASSPQNLQQSNNHQSEIPSQIASKSRDAFTAVTGNDTGILSERARAKEQINAVMTWFRVNEPSSPVCILLARAQMLVGKSYMEIANVVPNDLLIKWAEEMGTVSNISIGDD